MDRYLGLTRWFVHLLLLLLLLRDGGSAHDTDHSPLGIPMGMRSACDNARHNLEVDWDNSTDIEYTCQPGGIHPTLNQDPPLVQCLPKEDIPPPLHMCMTVRITYDDIPPRGGQHRPLWPHYGEYIYVPPQRWLHSLEHGAAVFLYHPCADPDHIEKLKDLARRCLRRHIISPYRLLPLKQPFAVVTYGCRLMMGSVNNSAVIQYVREYALKGPESTSRQGHYRWGLKAKSFTVTDRKDSGGLCPFMETDMNRPEQSLGEPEDNVRDTNIFEDSIDRLAAKMEKQRNEQQTYVNM